LKKKEITQEGLNNLINDYFISQTEKMEKEYRTICPGNFPTMYFACLKQKTLEKMSLQTDLIKGKEDVKKWLLTQIVSAEEAEDLLNIPIIDSDDDSSSDS